MENNVLESLKNARKSIGMTQQELAERSGINQANISKIENGVYNPSLRIVERLANGMNMKLRLCFEEKEQC